eukprot:COSAG02_NODE_15379_length_1176_cov_1.255339_2_plen_68_part_01
MELIRRPVRGWMPPDPSEKAARPAAAAASPHGVDLHPLTPPCCPRMLSALPVRGASSCLARPPQQEAG